MAGFLFGAGTGDTADSLKRKRELSDRLAAHLLANKPKTALEGAAALFAGIGGSIARGQVDKAQDEKTSKASEIYNKIMGDYSSKFPSPEAAGQVSGTSPAPSNAQASGGATNYRDAIASIESKGSGDYNAIGPTHPKMGRALGRYQVMEANIGPWSQEALGRAVTPEEFMANPQIQDAIFDKKFGGYVEKFGPEGAAQAWFGGPGGVGKTDRKDSLGTSIGAYGDKFNKAMGGNQVASLNPQAAFGAVLADPSQISPEDTQRLQAMRGPTGGNTPYSGPGAKIDTPMPVYDTNGLRMPQQGGSLTDEVAQFQQSPEYAAQFPGQQPQQAMPQPVQQQPAQQVAQAQPQPMPQAIQPNGVDPRILQALSDPFLPEEQRSALQILAKQQMEQQQRANEQQTWQQRLDYEQQLPSNQADIDYKRAQIEALRAKAANGEGADEWGLNPVWGKDKKGNTVLGQVSKSGKFKPLDTQDFTPTPGINNIDTGTSIVTRNSKTGETLSATPKENFKAAYDSAAGGATAKSDAETKAEFDSITSKMPGLYSVVDRLTDLADKATYTMAGKTLDWGINQLGMDPREAAVARAEYTATVDNQILPLLRDTFGAQFTNEEGLRLAKTLGDADKSPTEKQALLKAFIKQKERDIQALSGRVGEPAPQPQQQQQRRRYNPQTGNLE